MSIYRLSFPLSFFFFFPLSFLMTLDYAELHLIKRGKGCFLFPCLPSCLFLPASIQGLYFLYAKLEAACSDAFQLQLWISPTWAGLPRIPDPKSQSESLRKKQASGVFHTCPRTRKWLRTKPRTYKPPGLHSSTNPQCPEFTALSPELQT